MEQTKFAVETQDVNRVNDLMASGEWRQPEYDTHRSLYILIRKKVK